MVITAPTALLHQADPAPPGVLFAEIMSGHRTG
jgi:hypothetical protein